jgi:hypothetical protein
MEQRVNFSDSAREVHLQAFYAWLPAPLHTLPGIDWEQLPSKVMGYCVHSIGDNSQAGAIALAAGAAAGKIRPHTLWSYVTKVHALLGALSRQEIMHGLADLASKATWETFAQQTDPTHSRLASLQAYSSLAGHQRAYLEGLDPKLSASLQESYALPALPLGFLKTHGHKRTLVVQAHQRVRKKGTLLASLYYPLLALIDLRTQAARQLLQTFRRACADGPPELPHELLLRVTLPQLEGGTHLAAREATLRFQLWSRRAFVLAHPERLSAHALYNAQRHRGTYAPEKDQLFLAFEGNGRDLLWFGDLLEHDLLQRVEGSPGATADFRARKALARRLGAGNGFTCTRPGLLNAAGGWAHWLAALPRVANEYLFEPQSICLGTLYAAALARLALTSGMSTSELLQVSLDRHIPAEALGLVVTPEIHLQHLLAKSVREEERHYMLVSHQTQLLLDEICREITATCGMIPIVAPSIRSAKNELLRPERYIFQWAASLDGGRQGILLEQDVVLLIRFLLYDIDTGGEAIRIDNHTLRSTFTAILRPQGLPIDSLAWALHLRAEQNVRWNPALADTFPPQDQAALTRHVELLHRFHLEVEARVHELVQAALGAASAAQ